MILNHIMCDSIIVSLCAKWIYLVFCVLNVSVSSETNNNVQKSMKTNAKSMINIKKPCISLNIKAIHRKIHLPHNKST